MTKVKCRHGEVGDCLLCDRLGDDFKHGFGAECMHGSLARSCETCAYELEIATLKAKLHNCEAENRRLSQVLSDGKKTST